MLPEAFHQVSAQKDIWFGRCLKNFIMAVYCWVLLDILIELLQLFCETHLPAASHQVSAQQGI